MILCLPRVDAANLKLEGDLTWNITDPQCSFRLKGKLKNLGPTTGSLRLALWATTVPYPSRGTLVAEFPLGQLGTGYQYTNFTFKTKATLPPENGNLYYTVTVMEFTSAGWRNQLMVPTGTQAMYQGKFVNQEKWALPRLAVVDPPAKLITGNLLILNEQAMSNLNRFPLGWRETSSLKVLKTNLIQYKNRNLDKKVGFSYKVVKKNYLAKRASVGLVELKYTTGKKIVFTEQVFLFFQGPKNGTYLSTAKGSLWGESTNPWKTWGTFKLK